MAAYVTIQITACGDTNKKNEQSTNTEVATETTEDPQNTVSLSAEQYQAIKIKTGKSELRNLSAAIQVNGKLEVPPQNAVSITVPYGGIVKATSLLQGKRVSKGERLVTLENPEFIQLQQDYLDSKSQLEFLTTEYNRQQELSAQNINAKKTLQKAKADYLGAQNSVKGLKAKLSLLNINVNTLEKNGIQNTVSIYSPINGFVTQVNVNRGTYVSPNDMMFRIVNAENVYVELDVFEKDIPKLKIGQMVRFSLANDSASHTAKIYLIGKEIDKDRSIPVNCRITEKIDPAMVPGMYLKASIETGSNQVTALPEKSVVNFGGKSYIFLPEADKTEQNNKSYSFRMVEIQTGVTENGYTEVIFPQEFNAQTEIVIDGAYDLLSKMKNSAEEE
ncbi:MAG: efflux RND transporter periplasmic adaptor subunit [Hydrotalea sp. AMD]|uniref:efflux RND transporter periplasmic adaptor subunit n=1 Tax=Hydrotalea sp. AMD TaxID=2501297 RepID=UPI00102806BD|nr:efflux RND transporter periplasmic adaptor subunit [Hydrotalea sp. AMD]RWZ89433.1 MAG: efflux RND transporter periplasmic adaptor subunit [Hydrotalea sp. AMD]